MIRLAGSDAVFKDGETGLWTVAFSGTGTESTCLDFVRRLAAAVQDIDRLTDEELALELLIVESEDPMRFLETVPSPSTVRWGLQGPGLFGAGTSTVATLTREEVVTWVRERFTGDRAVVVLTGPWGLDVDPALSLPSPPSGLARISSASSGLKVPVAVPTARGGAVLSVLVPAALAPSIAAAAQHRFFSALRHNAGLAYVVDVQTDRVDAGTVLLEVVVGASSQRARETVVRLVELARQIGAHGFGDEAVARARLAASLTKADADARVAIVADDAVRTHLLGHPADDLEAELRVGELIEDEAMRVAWAAAVEEAVVMVDEDAELGDPAAFSTAVGMRWDELAPAVEVPVTEARREARGHRTWKNSLLAPLASDRGTLTDDELLVQSGTRAWRVPLQEVAVAVVAEGDVVLVMRDGRRLRIERDGWLRGASFVAAVVAAVEKIDPVLVRHVPPRPDKTLRPEDGHGESTAR
ncbi:hypothetical protein IFT72_15110 [Frigoribacterium sp. CFBP 8754]|uniref:hypothetical protein n=1 Tax=Frigoribacterium sp. CFBP 8754 TaxID=2775290 RepID=UPI00177C5DB6|nr:hypothetical protein [Frigoribacterium sp. CFBP 8754]MBD8661517.1 hypothetical protein [Frigoribacterium sp. CFBP 8754]